MVGFYKNNILFGKIENGIVYLINTLGKLKKLNAKFFLDESLFMQKAKTAYNAVQLFMASTGAQRAVPGVIWGWLLN